MSTAVSGVDQNRPTTAACPGPVGCPACCGQMLGYLRRIADALDSPLPEVVRARYVADRLGLTTIRVNQMVRTGVIPEWCVVPGSGGQKGRVQMFYRTRIDEWIDNR